MDDQNKSVNDRWAPGTTPEAGYAADRGYTAERGYAADEPADFAPDPKTAAIRSDIEHTRAEMTETIDAIQDRLRPSNMVSRAADSVREAAAGKVRQFTRGNDDGVPRRAADWYYGNSMMDRVRENPVPAAIAAVSLAWLAFGKRASRDYEGPPYGRSAETEYRPARSTGSDWSTGFAERRGQVAESASQAADAASDALARARNATSEAGTRVRSAGSQAQRRVQRLTNENTLTAGAIAAAVGMAIGFALPETDRENALMGEARDTVVDRASDAARGVTQRVQETAEQVQRVATSALTGSEPATTQPPSSRPPSSPAWGADEL